MTLYLYIAAGLFGLFVLYGTDWLEKLADAIEKPFKRKGQ